MSDLFYNPYQFIPVDTRKVKQEHLTTYETNKGNIEGDESGLERSDNKFVRHDFWHKESLSGRIRCSLSTLSPLVVGAEQIAGDSSDKNTPNTVTPYHLKRHGYAIPGNSLRGMVGSIAEVISQSTMRVLASSGEGEYSIRKSTHSPMTKLGLLLQENGEYCIYPLADTGPNGQGQLSQIYYKDNQAYLKLHDCYQHHTKPNLVEWGGQQGILRIRGKSVTKKRETFIPWDGEIRPDKYIPVQRGSVEKLDRMLKSLYASQVKTDADYESCQLWPKGYNTEARRPSDDDHSVVLTGDLLYYNTTGSEVTELSYSSIWRQAVPSDVFSTFEKNGGKNARPWWSGRSQLTPVEAMFGVVEETPNKEDATRNLASRIRFSDATTEGKVEMEEAVTLKILNSPKPPSPAMYFSAAGGRYVAKEDLDLSKQQPNGRKLYIPHPKGSEPWAHDELTDDPLKPRNYMRLSCTPIRTDSHFTFDVYFENLSVQELGLLQTALQPNGQNEQFIHRLGLGKPYGLGHVCIDKAEVEIINRQERYTLKRFTNASVYKVYQHAPDLSLVDQEEALPALKALADSGSYDDLPICYPYDRASDKSAHQTPQNEDNGFQWFVENDRKGKNKKGEPARKDYLHRDASDNASVMKPLASGKQRNSD